LCDLAIWQIDPKKPGKKINPVIRSKLEIQTLNQPPIKYIFLKLQLK